MGSNQNLPAVKAAYEAYDRLKADNYEDVVSYRFVAKKGGYFGITKTEYDYAQALIAERDAKAKAIESIPEQVINRTTRDFINPMRETLGLLEKENVDLFKVTAESDLSKGVEELIQKVLDLQKRWKKTFNSMSKENQALIRMWVEQQEAVELFRDYSEFLDRKAADPTNETYAAFRTRITSEVAADFEGLEGMERAEVLDNYTNPETWGRAIEDRAERGERIADKVLDSYIGTFGEQRFAQTFRGVAKQEGYQPPSVRAQPGKETPYVSPQQKAADTRAEKAREDAAIALTKLKGVEERMPGLFIVPKSLMTADRMQKIGVGGAMGMLRTDRVTVMEYSEVTGNPLDEGYAVKIKAPAADTDDF
jgi:sugar-specific transcriptional regulator TrmB